MTRQVSGKGRVLPPVYFLVAMIAMAVLHYIVPGTRLISPPFRYSGSLLLIGGIALVLWAAILFQRVGTAIKPFHESSALVAGGPYRITRNPMYLGMVVMLLGVGVLLGSATPFLIVPIFAVFIDLHFIGAEEAALERIFGSAYLDYKSKVRRWL